MIDIVKVERKPQPEWYLQLISDIRGLEYKGIVVTKHAIGKRILQDELKFGKPKYGDKTIEGLAKELDVSFPEVYRCVQFARKVPEFLSIDKNVSWEHVKRNILPEKTEGKPKTKTPVFYLTEPRHQAIINQIDIMIDMMDVRTCVEVPISLMRMELDKLKKSINQLTVK